MILHLVPDEKVVPRAIEQFEQANPNKNIFICFKNKKTQGKFVNESNKVFYNHSFRANEIKFHQVRLVCIHFLDEIKLSYYYKHGLNNKTTLLIPWGADLYNTFLYNRGFKIYSENNSFFLSDVKYHTLGMPLLVKPFVKFAKIMREYVQNYKKKKADRIIENFLTNDLDYLMASESFRNRLSNHVKMKKLRGLVRYTYYPIETTLGELDGLWCKGNNIMIGNSASFTNNHEYIYEYIHNLDLSNNTITLPMNYGGNEAYIGIVRDKFVSLPKCSILEDFLPLKEYNKLMLKTSTFVYGHFRGEAMGNILIALYLGGKVYMSKNSPSYNNLQRMGFIIFKLEEIQETFNYRLSDDEKINNRAIAIANYSTEKNKENIRIICHLS